MSSLFLHLALAPSRHVASSLEKVRHAAEHREGPPRLIGAVTQGGGRVAGLCGEAPHVVGLCDDARGGKLGNLHGGVEMGGTQGRRRVPLGQ
jgi:hypothetical protein